MYDHEGLFHDCEDAKRQAVWLPSPSKEKLAKAKSELPPNPVGLTARGRKCYGRNFTPEFYERIIWLLEDQGFSPVWLGEKVTTLPCPCNRIFQPNPQDLEMTLAYVKHMSFTIQLYTASSRLSGLMGTPFLIVESPDQIWGNGHEGFRLHLTSKGPKKLVLAHFRNILENNTKALRVMESAIRDMSQRDYSTTLSPLLEDKDTVRDMRRNNKLVKWF